MKQSEQFVYQDLLVLGISVVLLQVIIARSYMRPHKGGQLLPRIPNCEKGMDYSHVNVNKWPTPCIRKLCS